MVKVKRQRDNISFFTELDLAWEYKRPAHGSHPKAIWRLRFIREHKSAASGTIREVPITEFFFKLEDAVDRLTFAGKQGWKRIKLSKYKLANHS